MSHVPVESTIKNSLKLLHVDFAPRHQQPSALRTALATIIAIGGSLVADALIVLAGTHLFPAQRHYVHFQFSDYARLTVVGVVIACVGWPIVTRISSTPRWVFLRLAILVTAVLLLPDLYILHQGQPGEAVGTLMVMHLAIAVVTYNALVRIAPTRVVASSH
jgi:hypothetical protein